MARSPDHNPYVAKVSTLPGHLLPCLSGGVSAEERELLGERAGQFSKRALELGCGSGAHIIGLAERAPDTVFIGFELRFKRSFKAAEKAFNARLNNVLVLRTNAKVLSELFPSNSLSAVYVNFPDPWEKKRWKKHRLLSPEFLDVIWDKLEIGGVLSYKTDHAEYFLETAKILQNSGKWLIEKFTQDLHSSEFADSNILTEFERLFLSKGLKVNLLEAKKFVGPSA